MSDKDRSVVLPLFSGKDEDFQVWWTKFMAFATTKGVEEALMGREDMLPETQRERIDDEDEDQEEKIQARKRNNLAMSYLLAAFKAEADISLAYETMDDDWPGGLAYKVVEKLMDIYRPKDNITEVEVYERLLKVKMKKKDDPKTLFEQIAAIQNWYNDATKKLPKGQLIAVILKAAPDEYASVLTSEQEKRGTSLEMSHLRAVMNKYYRAVYKKDKESGKESEDSELQLMQKDGKGVKCFKCGKIGHIAKNCKNSKSDEKKFQGNCNICGKQGHKASDCWDNPKNADKKPSWYKTKEVNAAGENKSKELQLMNVSWGPFEEHFIDNVDEEVFQIGVNETKTNSDNEVNLSATNVKKEQMKMSFDMLEDPDIFILDTGASTNSTGNSTNMCEMKDAQGSMTRMGDGKQIPAKAIGKLKVTICDKNGKELMDGTLNDVHLIPGSPFNIVSGTKLLMNGYEMSGNKDALIYTKGDAKLIFDIKITTAKGMLFAIRMRRKANEESVVNHATKTMTVRNAHLKLGHLDEDTTRATAKAMGWTITKGSLKICDSCAKGKAKQKNIKNDEPHDKAKEVHGRVYLDQSRIVNATAELQPRRPNWRIIVDEATGFKVSNFYETKDKMVDATCELFKKWKAEGRGVQIIRMDNAGENKKLVKTLNNKDWQLYPTIEWTARDTPQQNHLAEVGFATIYGRGRAMMIEANIPDDKKHVVGQKAFETATKLDGLVMTTINGVTKTRVEHATGAIPPFVNNLRTWGEAGIAKTKTQTTPKMSDRGITCMFVGYATDHAGDTYEMLNWKTKRIIQTRDVIWLNKMYYNKDKKEMISTISEDNGSDDSDNETDENYIKTTNNNDDEAIENDNEETMENVAEETTPIAPETTTTRSGRVIKRTQRFIEEAEIAEIMAVGAGIGGGFTHTSELHPMKYDEAMRKDPDGWAKAVEKEYERMVEHQVFKAVKKSEVPDGAKILTSTWAMKQKADGIKRARVNARGFEQMVGEHYAEDGISSPVVNEASIFIILILMTMSNMWGELNDVKGAFLNGMFSKGERLYMYVPQGFEKYYKNDVVLLLLKTIYGLKQATFEYWQALLKAIQMIGLKRSKADPCVYYRWTHQGLNIWSSWVDDILSCGAKVDVDEGREALKQFFDLDEVGELKEYVGCKIERNYDEGWMKLTQPVLIQSFEDEFELPSQTYATPAAPNTTLIPSEVKLNEEKHREYRKGVGKLIHLAKYSRPGILNAVHELSRFGSGPNEAHYKAILRCMKYCVDTKKKGLKLRPNQRWDGAKDFEFEITGDSDSNFATDPVTRKSVGGWDAMLNGAPYVRKSKMQKFVTLSVTEAECGAATSCVQDMLFGMTFLESMGLKVKKPMTLFMDNKGGVDIFNNWSIAGNTRAISTRLAFIRELKEQGELQIIWRQGEDNPADIFTKNLDRETYEKHERVYCED